jgi:hypothetical protein
VRERIPLALENPRSFCCGPYLFSKIPHLTAAEPAGTSVAVVPGMLRLVKGTQNVGRARPLDADPRTRRVRVRQAIPAGVRAGLVVNVLTAPIIYSLFVPFAVLDLWVSLYQFVCFPIYGIARVPRRNYFALDRHRLPYLNGIEKLNCTFCSYANGLLAYVREVAARTEQYWCPIKHDRPVRTPHARYRLFVRYGDASGYRESLATLRHRLRTGTTHGRRLPRPSRQKSGTRVTRRGCRRSAH